MNFTQSSRRAGRFNTNIFPEAQVAKTNSPSYLAEKFYRNNGDTDVQLTKKEDAKSYHYLIGIAAIIAVVWFAATKLD